MQSSKHSMEPVEEYIVHMLKSGFTGDQIKDALRKQGYTDQQIMQYLQLDSEQLSVVVEHLHNNGWDEKKITKYLQEKNLTTKEINDILYPPKQNPFQQLMHHANDHGIHTSTLIVAAGAFILIIAVVIASASLYKPTDKPIATTTQELSSTDCQGISNDVIHDRCILEVIRGTNNRQLCELLRTSVQSECNANAQQ